MLDLGDSRTDVRAIDLESLEERVLVKSGSLASSRCRGGVKGDAMLKSSPRVPEFLARGEGDNGNRPPAVFVENMLWWLLIGVHTEDVAIM